MAWMKAFGDGHGDVEVLGGDPVALHGDEMPDVRVVDAQDAHVGAAARAALLDGLGAGVDDLQERDRARGDALGLAHETARRADAGEVEAGAAALLVDQGGVLHRLENAVQRILDGQDEAGGKAHLALGAGQGRRVGHEILAHHGLEEIFLPELFFRPRFFRPGR